MFHMGFGPSANAVVRTALAVIFGVIRRSEFEQLGSAGTNKLETDQ
jgi:hypothetical protein